MTAAEIWGSVVPAWLGGIGGMAAAIVSTIALIQSLRNKGGVETLKDAANKPTDPDDRLDEPTTGWSPDKPDAFLVEDAEEADGDYSPTTEQAELLKPTPPPRPIQSFGPATPAPSSTLSDESAQTNADRTKRRYTSPSAQVAVIWKAQRESKGKYRLKNDSPLAGASATLTGFRDVTPSGGEAAHYDGPLPVTIAPGESVPFNIEKSLVSPSIIAIELTWCDADGMERRRSLYV